VIEAEANAAHKDDVVLFDDEHQVPECSLFVDNNDDGALVTLAKTVRADTDEEEEEAGSGGLALPSRRRKLFRLGTNPKNKDLEVVDPYGVKLTALDGTIKINLAKLIMQPVTEDEIAGKRFVHIQNLMHCEFVHIGASMGNLMMHCEQYYAPVLEGLQRIIAETLKVEALFFLNHWNLLLYGDCH
jgi:hypothetical protein